MVIALKDLKEDRWIMAGSASHGQYLKMKKNAYFVWIYKENVSIR